MASQFDEIDADAMDDVHEGHAMRWLSIVVVFVAVIGFFALAWYAYHAGVEQSAGSVEVIKADSAPIKEAPTDPGGQQFPHQDKTVYNLVSGKEEPKTAERILPAPEEPIDRGDTDTWMNKKLYPNSDVAEAPTENVKPTPNQAVYSSSEEGGPTSPTVMEKPPTPPAEHFKPRAIQQEKPAVKPIKVEKPVAEETPKSELKPAAKPVSTSGPRVQLGAYKSEKEAQTEWARIKTRNAPIIADKQPDIVRADLGAKGVYYRLRVADFGGEKEAKSFCAALAANKQPCILVMGK